MRHEVVLKSRHRTVVPRLDGTYGSFLRFSAAKNVVTVEFAIGDAYGGAEAHDYLFTGSFEVSRESLLRLTRDLQAEPE